MNEHVASYGTEIPRIEREIAGTAFFPGGSGLWRGREPYGPMPARFPVRPIMVLGHNFDNVAGYERSVRRGVERLNSPTWTYLLRYLECAEIRPDACFFTNALMGLQPNSARGRLRSSSAFRSECRRFLAWQLGFLQPRLVAILGKDADAEFRNITRHAPVVVLRHPMGIIYVKGEHREDIVQQEAARLRAAARSAV